MKKLLLALSFLSIHAFSAVIPYNTKSCIPELSKNVPIYTYGSVTMAQGSREIVFDVGAMMNFMTSFYNNIENGFLESKDMFLLLNKKPLCLGMYHDKEGPNALAIGKDHVFFGLNLMHDLQADWKIDGETGMKIILAHEYAHIIQNRLGIKFNLPLSMVATKQKELQADCMAGVILGFHLNEAKVLLESERLLKTIGDHHFVGDHGTSEERNKAFEFGFTFVRVMKLRGKNLKNTTSQDVVSACLKDYPSYQ